MGCFGEYEILVGWAEGGGWMYEILLVMDGGFGFFHLRW